MAVTFRAVSACASDSTRATIERRHVKTHQRCRRSRYRPLHPRREERKHRIGRPRALQYALGRVPVHDAWLCPAPAQGVTTPNGNLRTLRKAQGAELASRHPPVKAPPGVGSWKRRFVRAVGAWRGGHVNAGGSGSRIPCLNSPSQSPHCQRVPRGESHAGRLCPELDRALGKKY
jgi:hypothetical protein